MRIDKLDILSPWKNLAGLHVDFSEEHEVAVLLGRNGSAKSNLLEALILIFRNIDLKEPAAFSYNIEYFLSGKRVIIDAIAGENPRGTVDQQKVSIAQIRNQFTPRYVVGYYSGMSDRFEKLFWRHDFKARELTVPKAGREPTAGPLELRRFIYSRPEHGLFALLAFYFAGEARTAKFLREVLRIEAFDSAMLVLKRPTWARPGSSAETFWGSRGEVEKLLRLWRSESLMPFQNQVDVQINFAHTTNEELQYLYLPSIGSLKSVAAPYLNNPRAFFQALDSMRLSELIQALRVRVRVKGADRAIHTRELSEGEQQLLTVLGLMRFTRSEESLYLLDEPDTHLNPTWGVNYLDWLKRVGQVYRNSHTIIATHDPLLVAGLVKEEIRILHRNLLGEVSAVQPDESPRGWGVAGLLTSDIFGLESQLDAYSLKVLKLIYRASYIEDLVRRSRYMKILRPLLPSIEAIEASPDPYRNVAREAYRLAAQAVRSSICDDVDRGKVLDSLAQELYNKATNIDDLH